MKTIIGTVLVVVLTLGVHASPKVTPEKQINHTVKEFSVELMDISPEYKSGEKGKMEMSSVFVAKQNDLSEELFGSFWAEFDFQEGNNSDMYEIKNWKVSDIRLAEDLSSEEKVQIENALLKELEIHFDEFPKSIIDGSLNSETENIFEEFNNEAPPIIYTNQPSALIVIDGDPFYEDLDKRYSKIANAGAFIIKDNKKGIYYMYGGGLWFSSETTLNGLKYNDKVPNRINGVMRKHARDLYDNLQNEEYQTHIVPEIIVTTEPAEIISTDGGPKYVLIPNTNLVYVENTDAELFRDINTNKYYALFSGRWFISDRLEGNWQYLAPGALPAGFAKIPEEHEKNSVLASVPGTKAALNAIRDAQVPYVTKKEISTILDKKINYNGEPEFVGIDGTGLSYAVNTTYPVLLWNNRYYLVDEAVWYNSSSPYGSWHIATQRPAGIENIPADNPLYNLKYVYVYKNTENEIYTGFTSGYTGTYIYGPTVVYGTGFHYGGWHGHFYYHHPMTYGYGFFYDPFYGWVPVYSPWFRSSFYWHYRPWYGYRPPHYRPPHHRPPSGPKPEHPIARPDRPSSRPEQPVTRPSQPEVRPTQPATRPSQPNVRPTQPATRPSQPAFRPSQPMRPTQPAVRPSPGPAQMRR